MKKLLFILIALISWLFSIAGEGMWIPLLLEKYNYEDMQAKGFRLTPEDIYSINHSSLKDAVVIFGGGCTGEVISDQGLIITNHHCGFGTIQRHSSLEHDYLTDGFWAQTKEEELSSPWLKVTFLVRMDDVTAQVLNGVSNKMTEAERDAVINKNIGEITSRAVTGTHYEAVVESFYYGNQYFLFINEVFKDVRLVGAPPSSIGKFGGDTDNWMWPRHTGDFSLFRIYSDPNGKPAAYSKNNIPLKPRKHMSISLKGVQEGDFTMVLGYPGSTEQYIPSYAVDITMNQTDPNRISLREARLRVINQAMDNDRGIRIQYANKAASIANGWKKWIGEVRGLKRLNAVHQKELFERAFQKWTASNRTLTQKYGDILSKYESLYTAAKPYYHAYDYLAEAGFGIEVISFAGKFNSLYLAAKSGSSKEDLNGIIEKLKPGIAAFYKDYQAFIDHEVMKSLLKMYYKNVPSAYLPTFLCKNFLQNSDEMIEMMADNAFEKSIFTNQARLDKFLLDFKPKNYKKLELDPVFIMYRNLIDLYINKIEPVIADTENELDSLNRVYMKAQMEFMADSLFYPDANFTMRLTYGKVSEYKPCDAVTYKWYTTLDGIIEKDNPEIYDYDVPDKIKELYKAKDYGRYADADGKLHVAFIATNHTTGGNSGSPVLNADGELIGVNFDRNWEGTMSDIMYDPSMCRNISLDIRYALFVIEKYAGADHLIEEMTIVE
ncbi:MAG: S46 family peptidase [Bacteroidales bacterium]|nr:S46 family peptidase [Bacteroidales bacterium]HOY40036.1 S46 family peptidase [Bacteroidales bacterium]HQP04916.1 S46 family peptidase [Bacteroidales bacterium]